MAVKLVHSPTTQRTVVITGYEGGLTAVFALPRVDTSSVGVAQLIYLSQPHIQPILSLDVSPNAETYFTSGADATIAAHHIPAVASLQEEFANDLPITLEDEIEAEISLSVEASEPAPQNISDVPNNGSDFNTAHAEDPGHSDISTSDSQLPSSTSQDSTYSSLSFTKRNVQPSHAQTQRLVGGLSSLLANEPPHPKTAQLPRPTPAPTVQKPHKVNNTKHAGQQSLSVRSDGRLLATGGWDSRVRIYSCKTLKEVAVLKWHKEGVYAVAFGEVLDAQSMQSSADGERQQEQTGEVVKRESGLSRVQRQREEKMQVKHWVAAGAKDGKVSLWEVF